MIYSAIYSVALGHEYLEDIWSMTTTTKTTQKFPFYDVYREGKITHIELALAGYMRDELDVMLDGKTLIIKTNDDLSKYDNPKTNREYKHQGISKRKFEQKFTVAADLKVIDATFANGILHIELKDTTPKTKATKIKIN